MEEFTVGNRRRGVHPRLYVGKERLESEDWRPEVVEKTISRLSMSRPILFTRGMDLCEMFLEENFECSPSCPRYHECGSLNGE